ncbi:MAG TPA: aspartate--tRNA ligase [Candidatus Aminicenantes bacterium]|nr:aspartate--tRNA ligase [Candidatus Aminicenantes bacterium]
MKSKSILRGKRTHFCGELRKKDVDKEVILFGWVNRIRDIGNLIFIDLRDREGLAQVVISSEQKDLLGKAKNIRMEYVLAVKGVVKPREEGMKNHELATGDIEVLVKEMEVLSQSETLPFVISDPVKATEEMRFKYRYLDLRRPSMQKNIRLRHRAALIVRNFLDKKGFYEIETPFLTKSTPEGARDYLVPSREYKGRFFALPQSPQLFKQIFMISGFDRYFQIVRCFRDEDLRADRQPEFTQIDMEMSFAGQEDVFSVTEEMIVCLFDLIGARLSRPFPRLTYEESMERFGTDRPDLRNRMEIIDLTDTGLRIDSRIIRSVLQSDGVLKGLVVQNGKNLSRSRLDKVEKRARGLGAKGIIWIKKEKQTFTSPLRLKNEDFTQIWEKSKAGEDDLILLVADKKETALRVLGELRTDFFYQEKTDSTDFQFVWITDFPLFEWSEDENKLVSMHHPFTSPKAEDMPELGKEPLKVKADAYDLVVNGVEIGGGSIRIKDRDTQERIFRVLGLDEKEQENKFGFFLKALTYGAPPHGGIALGFDRIVMILAGEESIRDVIPFPKTTSSLCLMTDSPSEVDENRLKEVGIQIIKKNKGGKNDE